MNQLVRSWDRYQSRPKYNGPDAVEIEGQKIQIERPEEMAQRKSPVTKPVLDNSALNEDKNLNRVKKQKELNKDHFQNVIRFIKRSSLERVNTLKTATEVTLKRLGRKRNLKKAVSGVPEGSDHADIGTLVTWLNRVDKSDKKAVDQVLAIDATCFMRTDG